MSPLWEGVAVIVSLVLALVTRRRAVRSPHALIRTNYAGRPVPVVLGKVLVTSANWGLLVALPLALLAGPVPEWPVAGLILGGTYLLMLIGVLDDRASDQARGLAAHLGALLRGHVTTGIWKLAAGVVTSAIIAIALAGGPVRVIVGTVVIALSINVVNALDVRPGRAITWSVLIWVGAMWVERSGPLLAVSAYVGAAVAVWGYDARERGMLGDAGSNPLGLVVGTALAAGLPMWGLLTALVVLGALQVAAETVTISRLIDATPPLRWLDRFGRGN